LCLQIDLAHVSKPPCCAWVPVDASTDFSDVTDHAGKTGQHAAQWPLSKAHWAISPRKETISSTQLMESAKLSL